MIDYDKLISEKCKGLKPSGIRKFFEIATSVEGVISLGVGEPDFQTPWAIRRTAITALERGKTVYTANSGLLELRTAITSWLKRKINVEYNAADEVIVTVGGSEAIDLTIRALVNPGDEVLIPEPCFVCYNPIVALTGGVPVTIETREENHFRLTAEELREKITDRTKLLILPFPNNPTGAVMERRDLEAVAELLRGTDIMVLSDEIYSELTYTGSRHVSIAEIDGMRERTIVVNGFSKAFAMTGWRMGFSAAPAPVTAQMLKIHQYAVMCSPTVSQYAAVEALKCDAEVADMVREYNIRRRWVTNAFNEMGLTCFEPMGAFYVFPCIKSTGLSSVDFCEQLLYKYKIAVVPGDAFGDCGEGYIRVSYAYSLKHLKEALARIKEFIDGLK
ncbi:MAG: aminotransferase class I/II-fold pyridoxal phosphate-dependent enzyme [Oscillospiraceae bacterium]|nr:aminotransferase class I/II-fold pyridoxal phosphate-dependent enzyme [Oscillospiraceae bacterium]